MERTIIMRATNVSQYLQHYEDLKFTDKPHWIYLVSAVFWAGIMVLVGYISRRIISSYIIYPRLENNFYADGFILNIAAVISSYIIDVALIFALLFLIKRLAFYFSTYMFASDKRLYMKTGVMRVIVSEISHDEIRKSDITYGFLGRFLGYGRLLVDARFVKNAAFPYVYYPERFAKLIHLENDINDDENLKKILDEETGKKALHDKEQKQFSSKMHTYIKEEQGLTINDSIKAEMRGKK